MPQIEGSSDDFGTPGVVGKNSAAGDGVWGEVEPSGRGVVGVSSGGAGVWGVTDTGRAVFGGANTSGTGVWGKSETGTGVAAESVQNRGLIARSQTNTGVFGESKTGRGVEGYSESNYGVYGQSGPFPGVRGTSTSGRGVEGWSTSNAGLWGTSHSGPGIEATGSPAGRFHGDVEVRGDVRLLGGQDCAEDFDVVDGTIEPGSVMVVSDHGKLTTSTHAYDRRVVGVVSGAGQYRPGLILDNRERNGMRLPIGLLGKVYCKVDAVDNPIEVGDLLTSSGTPGHAMKATDPMKAFGAVIGKALGRLSDGRGVIPVLVTLQ